MQDTTQWVPGAIKIAGQVQMELYDHSMGLLLKNFFGSSVITGAGPYTNTLTPGDLTGLSMTVQVGRPSVAAGVVQPFTYPGCKVGKWQLACQAGQIATLGFDLVGTTEIRYRQSAADGVTTNASPNITSASAAFSADDVGKPISSGTAAIPAGATILSVTSPTAAVLSANCTAPTTLNVFSLGVPLAAASYTVQNPVSFIGSSLIVAGSSVPVKQLTISGDNKLDDKRDFLAVASMGEALEIDTREYKIDFLPEFNDLTLYNRYARGETAALNVTLASGTNAYLFTFNVRFDGDTPNVSGTKIVEGPMKAVAIGSTDAAACTLVTSNSDAAL